MFETGTSFSVLIMPECVKGMKGVNNTDELEVGLQLTPFLPVVVIICELLLFDIP